MTIIQSFTHRNIETDTQTTNEIFLLISVIDEAMYHFDLFTTTIKVETYHKRKPLTVIQTVFIRVIHLVPFRVTHLVIFSVTRFNLPIPVPMHTFQLDKRPYRAETFNGY